MEQLPKNIITLIYTYLHDRDSLNLALTAHKFCDVYNANYTWQLKTPEHDIEMSEYDVKTQYRIYWQLHDLHEITKTSMRDLYANKDMQISSFIGEKMPQLYLLSNLTNLDILHSNLRELPQLNLLVNLKMLNVSNNKLRCLPNMDKLVNCHI
jgi:Leucine-rich repeat (LRR) protein